MKLTTITSIAVMSVMTLVNLTPIEAAEASKVFASKTKGTANIASNSHDGDLNTHWSAKGEGEYIQYKFEEATTLEAIKIAFKSSEKRAYTFQIESTDTPWSATPNWQQQPLMVSEKTEDAFQTFNLTESVTAKFFRIVGYGYEGNWGWASDYISIAEIEFVDENQVPDEQPADVQFMNSTEYSVKTINGQATWEKDISGDLVYNNNGTTYTKRAILYSTEAFQSDNGFKLSVEYTTGSIGNAAAHNFSFGLVSDETDLSSYDGFNPFKAETSVYSLGVNLTEDDDVTARGLNFTNGTERVTLDESGTHTQFDTGETTKVYLEIGIGGSYQYRINDEYEASGVLLDGFDPSKSYHVVVYGQDDHGDGKSIQSIHLEKAPASGERAAPLRGTWYSGIHPTLIDDRLKSLKTLGGFGVGMSDGASLSAKHFAPNKLLESIEGSEEVVPSWGDLSADEPEDDVIMDYIHIIKDAGFKVKMYTNSENFVGTNHQDQFLTFIENWKAFCDTDPEVQAFINSQPFHTGIWNSSTEQYEDASENYPDRKYMFAYAEYVLKEHSLRYGKYVSSWIFDSAKEMVSQGDSATSGEIEEQRIYQAFANAARAGNPDIPVSFNNGRSTVNYNSYPFAHANRFDDFTFGHAFGGNNNHAEKVDGNQFNLNYQHITRMTDTNGYVHAGGNWDWDDLIVGNFHSKISTTAWKYGPNQAWEQDDFNQWSLEAMQAGGTMTWDGSYNRVMTAVYDYVYVMFEELDEYLMEHRFPGAPNWSRPYTILPDAVIGELYTHNLVAGEDFWDPEGDDITAVSIMSDLQSSVPQWLSVSETAPGVWTLSGTPVELEASQYSFNLQVSDASNSTLRTVDLSILKN